MSGAGHMPPGSPECKFPGFYPPPDGDTRRQVEFNAAIWSTTTVAMVFVIARFWVRIRIVRNHGWDDWIMGAAMVLGIASAALESVATTWGYGTHQCYLTPAQITMAQKFNFIAIPFNLTSSTLAKVSVALALMRISEDKIGHWFLKALIAVLLVFQSFTIILLYAQCNPVEGLWNHLLVGACIDPKWDKNTSLVSGILAIFADFTLALFPLTFLWKLQVNRATKIALSIIMAAGVFAGASGIVRTVQLQTFLAQTDPMWALVDLGIWSVVEQNVTIIAACTPPLRPLFKSIFGGSTRNKHYYDHSAYGRFDRNRPSKGAKDSYGLSDVSRSKSGGIDDKSATVTSTQLGGSSTPGGRTDVHGTPYASEAYVMGPDKDVEDQISESDSDRRILPMQGNRGNNDIMRTVEVRVTNSEMR